jgi:hypothetical protein
VGGYAAGYQSGIGSFTYGPGVRATAAGGSSGNNAVVVQYDSATGAALWAKAATGGNAVSTFNDVAVDSSGSFATVGQQTGIGTFTYGGRVTAQGSGSTGTHAVVVGWR